MARRDRDLPINHMPIEDLDDMYNRVWSDFHQLDNQYTYILAAQRDSDNCVTVSQWDDWHKAALYLIRSLETMIAELEDEYKEGLNEISK